MIKINSTVKRIIYFVLLNVILFTTTHYFKEYLEINRQMKTRMYYDFKGFGITLEELNDDISQILALEKYDFGRDKEFIDTNVLGSFRRSSLNAEDIGKSEAYHYLDDAYYQMNTVLENIIVDGRLSKSESHYLNTLYNYNQELIDEYKEIMGELYYKEWNFEKMREIEENIVKIYNEYSKKADSIINTTKYSFIKSYKGDFENINFEEIEKYSKKVFSILVKDQTLKYNNKDEFNSEKIIFTTYKESDTRDIFTKTDSPFGERVDYNVEFDKRTKEINVMAVGFIVPSRVHNYTEDELDKIADKTISEFEKDVSKYRKQIKYYNENELGNIQYSYIEQVDGIYDEMKRIDITIEPHGLVSRFRIIYPDNKEIALPQLTKEEIISKVNKEAEVIDVLLIRNIEGDIEYEVHLKYNNTLYAAVYDGDDGRLKYYGREIRNYNSNIN